MSHSKPTEELAYGHEEAMSDSCEPHGAFCTPILLAHMFAHFTDLRSLGRAAAVCKIWNSVLKSDEIWRSAYLASHSEPRPHELLGSYRQIVQRLFGLIALPSPEPSSLKGSAICYNAATGNLVSFNARQRLMSVQDPDGLVQSAIVEVSGAASASKPLLASSGSNLVILSAFDGLLEVWDAATCRPAGRLGIHPAFVTALSASGPLIASICSSQLNLWDLPSRTRLWSLPLNLTSSSYLLEPRVVVSEQHQLLAAANCGPPTASSSVKVYSTAAKSCGELVVELPANAPSDLVLQDGLLLAGSSLMGRSIRPGQAERSYTVVVTVWQADSWQCTRLISPQLTSPYSLHDMLSLPLLHITQGMLLVAAIKGSPGSPPSCSLHAWTLPAKPSDTTEGLWWGPSNPAREQRQLPGRQGASGGGGGMAGSSSSSSGNGAMNSTGPASLDVPFGTFRITARSQRGVVLSGPVAAEATIGPGAAAATATVEGVATAGGDGSSSAAPAAAATGAAGPLEGPSSSSSSSKVADAPGPHGHSGPQLVMRDGMVQGDPDVTIRPEDARLAAVVLMVGQNVGRDAWRNVMGDTRGQLTGFFTTPTHFVGVTVAGQVLMSRVPYTTGATVSSSSS